MSNKTIESVIEQFNMLTKGQTKQESILDLVVLRAEMGRAIERLNAALIEDATLEDPQWDMSIEDQREPVTVVSRKGHA